MNSNRQRWLADAEEDFDLDDLIQAMDERGYVHQRDNWHKLTSRELRHCESEAVSAAWRGPNTRFELCRDYRPDQGWPVHRAGSGRATNFNQPRFYHAVPRRRRYRQESYVERGSSRRR